MKRERLNRILSSKWLYLSLIILTVLIIIINLSKKQETFYDLDDTTFEGVLTNLVINKKKISYTIEGRDKLVCNYYLEDEKNTDDIRAMYQLGSKVKIEGTLSEPINNTIPNTFNYKKYLYNHGIYHTCIASSIEIVDNRMNGLYSIKNFVVKRIMTFEMKDYMYTLLIGDKSLLDEETFEKYRKNGVTHLFAISGMHIGLFSGVMLAGLKKLHLKKNKRYILTVTFIWLYAFLTGFSPSVLRACVLFSLLSLIKMNNLRIETLNVLIISGCLLLWYDSYLIFDIGFIYSFTTTFGLLYSSKVITRHKVLGTSLVATLYSLPITVQNFFKINLLSILFNIIFVPLVSTIIYPLCILTFVFRFLSPFTKMSIFFLEMLNDFLARIDFLYMVIPKMSTWLVIIYYFILLIGLKKKFYVTCMVLILCVILNKAKPLMDADYHIEFLDVGQGDSAIVRSPRSKEVILVDTGGKETFGKSKTEYHVASNTITYLNSLGIDKLDYMILTHGDVDHLGDALYVLKNIKVKHVILNRGEINDKERDIIDSSADVRYDYNGKLDIKFLNNTEWKDENSNSIIFKLNVKDVQFLFMGDAGKEVEKNLLTYNDDYYRADIIKLGHHGSKTSSDEKFLKETKVKEAIISSGRKNLYGHPNKETISTLNNLGIKYYNTQITGSILYKVNDKVTKYTYPP